MVVKTEKIKLEPVNRSIRINPKEQKVDEFKKEKEVEVTELDSVEEESVLLGKILEHDEMDRKKENNIELFKEIL